MKIALRHRLDEAGDHEGLTLPFSQHELEPVEHRRTDTDSAQLGIALRPFDLRVTAQPLCQT